MFTTTYNNLMSLREFFEQEPRFSGVPDGYCQIFTKVVSLVFGYCEVAGEYVPGRDWHAWGHNVRSGVYVDLSLDQFDVSLPNVNILPDNTSLLKVTEEATNEQRSLVLSELLIDHDMTVNELFGMIDSKVNLSFLTRLNIKTGLFLSKLTGGLAAEVC
jgi:hypothetical protein